MERSSRFSFRRKNSHPKAVASLLTEKISYVSFGTARELYAELTTEYHLKLEQIVETIGFLCATLFVKVYPKSSLSKDKASLLVCCGPGLNGIEGLVCSRHLKSFGYRPTIFYPHVPSTSLEEATKRQCERLGIPFLYYLPSEAQLLTDSYNVIIDAIYGFDVERPIPADIHNFIQTIVRSKLPVVSIDCPSGWDDDYCTEDQANALCNSHSLQNSLMQPETLISTLVPLTCCRSFNGKHHYLLGHLLLPSDLLQRFGLLLPSYSDSDQSTFDLFSLLPHTPQETSFNASGPFHKSEDSV